MGPEKIGILNKGEENNWGDFLSRQRIKAGGEMLIEAIFRLIKVISIHESNNRLIMERIDGFRKACKSILESGNEPKIICSMGQFFIGRERIPFTRGNFDLFNRMADEFSKRKITVLSFSEGVDRAHANEIYLFFRAFLEAEKREKPCEFIKKVMDSKSITWVDIRTHIIETIDNRPAGPKERARRSYLYSITAVKEVHRKLMLGERGGIRKAKRLIQNLVDLIIEDEAVVMGLTTLKNYDDYTYNHSVNVAVLAICLGRRIGLDKNSLMELGICGLFHDIGKVLIPKEILEKKGSLSEWEWEEMKRHPVYSVGTILRLQAPHEMKARIIISPFEHHLKYDLTGYPRVNMKRDTSLFGRIIMIVDCYDAMTSERNYRTMAIAPDRALSFMLERSGKDFDPVILKVFVQMMGLFPVGTLVELDTGEIGIVFENNPLPDMLSRPRILLLYDKKGRRLSEPQPADLSLRDENSGTYLRSIKKTINPRLYNINPADYFL